MSIRRSAARALARISGEPSRILLERALADEDSEVVSWAAWGLGRICTQGAADSTIRHLQGRAATLLLSLASSEAGHANPALSPWYALAQGVGRCAHPEAERVLRSWLHVSPELARVAAQGLDCYVQTAKRLSDSTIVALLEVAEKERGLAVALLPISRLAQVDALVGRRLLALAPRVLETAGDERRFVLRALPLAEQSSIAVLERVAVDDSRYQPLERVEAIRALSKLGGDGQRSLFRLIPRIISDDSAASEALLLSARWSLLTELLEQLTVVPSSGRARLARIAQLDAKGQKSPAMRRRIAALRCRAAALAAENDVGSPLIEQCDLSGGHRYTKLARLAVLNRHRLSHKQSEVLGALTVDPDPIVSMAALDSIGLHDELKGKVELVTSALSADSTGVVSTAARWIAEHPQQVPLGKQLMADLSTTLEDAMKKPWPADSIEVRVSLIDAAAQLGLLTLKPEIRNECVNGSPLVRHHAEQALQRLGEPNQRCLSPTKRELPTELDHLESNNVTLRFHTDVGILEIRLEPRLAPVAVTRLADLARTGFYDGVVVHRVVSGFVVQLGDRGADGFGGSGKRPIPCELAPQPFSPLDVGIALSGPDSGSSQFFVTLGPYPQLGGEYTRVGRAGPGWDKISVGDIIQKVELLP